MTTLTKTGIALILLGAGLAALGLSVGGPFVAASVAVFGVAGIVGGVDSVATRRHHTGQQFSSSLQREHTGASALVFGLTFIAVGAVMAVAGSASAIGVADGLWSWVRDNPGVVAIVLGAWICVLGLATMFSRWTYVDQSTVWWQRLPGMEVGLLIVLMGVVLIGLGKSLAEDPPASGEVFETVLETFTGWLGLE